MKKQTLRTLACALLAAMVLTAFAAMAPGSGSDPLVTLSYLTETFTGQVMEKVDAALAARRDALWQELDGREQPSGSAAYTVLTLQSGQMLRGEAGCEVLLRRGSAASTTELADTTTGGSVRGALEANHLYLMTEAGGIQVGSDATLLVRGSCAVE